MPTSIHIPKPLLDLIDDRSRALHISRNLLIVRALEREIQSMEWTPGFFDRLGAVDSETAEAVDDLLATVRARRNSKLPQAVPVTANLDDMTRVPDLKVEDWSR